MTVRLCGLLHELLNCGGKVHVKKLVCLLPARRNVMGARLCCSRISNCEGLFDYTVVIITRFIFCMLFEITTCVYLTYQCWLVGGGRTPVLTFPHGDLRFGARPPRRLVALFVGVRACGLPPSAFPSTELWPCGLSRIWCHESVGGTQKTTALLFNNEDSFDSSTYRRHVSFPSTKC
jgi:hypothetical protein